MSPLLPSILFFAFSAGPSGQLCCFSSPRESLIPTGTGRTGEANQPAREVQIPAKSDWKLRGVALKAGGPGSWDTRLFGQISPCTALKSGGVYYLYYIGADGARSTDGGPRHRALGVATSTDGVTFHKYEGNPVLTHLPHKNQEEGVFSAGGALNPDGSFMLYYGAIWAANRHTENVHSYVALSKSPNGKEFQPQGYALCWDKPHVWGHGDEIFPLGAFIRNGTYNVYYGAKGSAGAWKLGFATGPSARQLTESRPALTQGEYIGGCDPVFLTKNKLALFIVCGFASNRIEVRTSTVEKPCRLSEPVRTYEMFKPRYRHATVLLDRESRRWFMYHATDRPEDGNKIVVRTAPLTFAN